MAAARRFEQAVVNVVHWLVAPLACFVVATVVQPFVIPLLRRSAVMDVPGLRSSHTVPTPRGGGIALGLGLLVGTSILDLTWLPLIVAIIAFFAIGLAEDLRGVPIVARLALQLLAGAAVGLLLVLSAPPSMIHPGIVVIIAAVWMTAFVNAFNFMDGINGISGAHALLGGLAFAMIGMLSRDPSLVVVSTITAAAGLAFLPWNAVHARVFLGDVGSYTLGAVLAALAVYTVLRGVPIEAVLAPLSLYLVDTGSTLVRRMVRGEPWLQPHRGHVYQRLCDRGWSHLQVTLVTFGIGGWVSALGAVSLIAVTPWRVIADVVAAASLVAYLNAPRLLLGRTTARPPHGRAAQVGIGTGWDTRTTDLHR